MRTNSDAKHLDAKEDYGGSTPLEIVTLEFDEDLQGAYLHAYDWLNLELDLDDIKSARIQIAGILNKYTSPKDNN